MRSIWASSGRRLTALIVHRSSTVCGLVGAVECRQTTAVASEIARWQKVALAVHERRAHRQGRRPEGLDGAGHPDRGSTGAADEDAGLGTAAKSRFTLWRATPAMAMSTTSWSGNGPGWSRRDVPTCCSATCAMSPASLPVCANEPSARRPSAWPPRPRRARPKARSTWTSSRGGTASSRRSWRPGSITWDRHQRRRGQDRHALDRQDHECVGLRLRQRLELGRAAQRRRQLFGPARSDPRQLKPHSVAMHPSPSLRVAAGWKSPVSAVLRVEGRVQHAHPECGNGVTWSLELRRGAVRQKLAAGVAHGRERSDGRSGAGSGRPARRPGLALDRPARRQPRVRPDGRRPHARRRRSRVEPGAGGLARHSRGQSSRRCARQSRRLALLLRARQGRLERVGDPRRLAAGPVASGGERRREAAAGAGTRRLCSSPARPPAKDSPDGLLYRQLSSLRGPLVERRPAEGACNRAGESEPSIPKQPRSVLPRPFLASTRAARRSTPRASACKRPSAGRFDFRPTWLRAASL